MFFHLTYQFFCNLRHKFLASLHPIRWKLRKLVALSVPPHNQVLFYFILKTDLHSTSLPFTNYGLLTFLLTLVSSSGAVPSGGHILAAFHLASFIPPAFSCPCIAFRLTSVASNLFGALFAASPSHGLARPFVFVACPYL